MSIVLTRVDDRLIHGQVVVAWGQALNPAQYVIADDEIAQDEFEHDIYRAGVPAGATIEFLTVAEMANRAKDFEQGYHRTLILLADVASAVQLCRATDRIRALNLGGVHDATGRTRYLPYLYLSSEELEELGALVEQGVDVSARDVPTAPAVPVQELRR